MTEWKTETVLSSPSELQPARSAAAQRHRSPCRDANGLSDGSVAQECHAGWRPSAGQWTPRANHEGADTLVPLHSIPFSRQILAPIFLSVFFLIWIFPVTPWTPVKFNSHNNLWNDPSQFNIVQAKYGKIFGTKLRLGWEGGGLTMVGFGIFLLNGKWW